jgi:hypothetical protein
MKPSPLLQINFPPVIRLVHSCWPPRSVARVCGDGRRQAILPMAHLHGSVPRLNRASTGVRGSCVDGASLPDIAALSCHPIHCPRRATDRRHQKILWRGVCFKIFPLLPGLDYLLLRFCLSYMSPCGYCPQTIPDARHLTRMANVDRNYVVDHAAWFLRSTALSLFLLPLRKHPVLLLSP